MHFRRKRSSLRTKKGSMWVAQCVHSAQRNTTFGRKNQMFSNLEIFEDDNTRAFPECSAIRVNSEQ